MRQSTVMTASSLFSETFRIARQALAANRMRSALVREGHPVVRK
jgi:hypothetical protein